MILESGACLYVRFNDWTQVILSSRRQGIPMTFFAKTLNQLRRLNQVVPDHADESVECNLGKIGRKIAWKVRTVMWTVSIRYLAVDMYIIGHF